MDISALIAQLTQGNNPILIILAIGVYLFREKLFPPKPVTPPVVTPVDPTVPVAPVTPVVPSPHPVVDTIVTQVLPVLIPMLVKLIQDQVKSAKDEAAKS